MDVTAKVRRSGEWWAVAVPEVPGAFTQAKRLDRAEEMAAEAVALILDEDLESIHVTLDLELDEGLRVQIDGLASMSNQLEEFQAKVRVATQEIVTKLRPAMSVRDVGKLVDLSPQRVSQIEHEARK